jgi:hypothetical protein
MKLLIEKLDSAPKLVVEESDNGVKQQYLKGVFLQGGVKNRNGRVYPNEVLDNAVRKYVEEYVKTNRGYGELSHPDTPEINLDRVSHLIVDLQKDGGNWIGKAKLLDTPMGKIAKGILEGGGVLGVSSRGIGSLDEQNNVSVVQPDYILCTAADIVADPSAPDAFVQSVMENREWVFVNNRFVERDIARVKRNIRKVPKSHIQEQALREFKQFLKSLG